MPAPTLNKYFGTYKSNALGQIELMPITDVSAFARISVEASASAAAAGTATVVCMMGVISGQTLASEVVQFPLSGPAQIHTCDVVGPEFSMSILGAPVNSSIALQAWVFLR